MPARADLHVHSKHSNQPSEWILRQFRAPESYTEPLEVYRRCRERGMDFVTLSDHDSIDGALEIAHLPGTFLSCEVTVEFPEDGCEIHCLVTGITEVQHRDIQKLRRNVYELRDYLQRHGVLHSIAHPLFGVNDRLTLDHVEKLLVLFNRFEAINGMHERRANALVRRIFGSLRREVIESLAERHRLEPLGATPWVKTFTGGSDDHCGLYIATAYTETPPAATVVEYLDHVRLGRHEAVGETGGSLRLVQSLYSIAWEHYRRQFPALLGNRKDPFAELLRGLAQRPAEREPERRPGLRDRLAQVVAFPGARRSSSLPPSVTSEPADRATLTAAGRAHRDLFSALARDFVRQLRRGRLAESLSAVSHLAPLALSVAPYLVSLHAHNKDAGLLEMASLRFLGHGLEEGRPGRTAWFADALTGVGGTGRTARHLANLALERGSELVVLTCGKERRLDGLPVRTFEPLLRIPLPGREPQTLAVPPLLEMLELCERERYTEIFVSTPGPMGLAGLAAGKVMGLRLTGFCPAGLPLQVRRLAGDPSVEDVAWFYLRWFFGQMDRIHVTSRRERDQLAERGFDPSRLELLREEGPAETAAEVFPAVNSGLLVLESAL